MRLFCCLLGLLTLVVSAHAADRPALEPARLTASLDKLTGADHQAAEKALALIRKGEHSLALAQLTALTRQNPDNSSVRILAAYSLLQLGNLVGAFTEARKAESAPDANSYSCWFLAKVALIAGDRTVCRREIGHLRHDPTMAHQAAELEKQLKR